jgi:hypothetical protein
VEVVEDLNHVMVDLVDLVVVVVVILRVLVVELEILLQYHHHKEILVEVLVHRLRHLLMAEVAEVVLVVLVLLELLQVAEMVVMEPHHLFLERQ